MKIQTLRRKFYLFLVFSLFVLAAVLLQNHQASTATYPANSLPLCSISGGQPPDCVEGHDVTLVCDLTEVFEYGSFIGWNLNVSATTSPSVNSNLNGYGTYSIFENANYTSQYTYTKFIPASIYDPRPTFEFTAGVTEPFHLGGQECRQTDNTPPGGILNPVGQITASPNPCAIPSGGVVCTSYLNWSTSDVVEARVYVSKNGGPESQFSGQLSCTGQTCPANFITSSPDFFDFRLYNYSGGIRQGLLDSVTVTGERTSPVDQQPNGNFENAECTLTGGSITGWAFDPDEPSVSINVLVYRDGPIGGGGVYVGSYPTNILRQDVNTAFNITGEHGFSVMPLPNVFRDGLTHQVYVYAVNNNPSAPNQLLLGSPRPVQCPMPPSCPSTTTATVILANSVIRVGGKTLAIAPTGWTGGKFVSSSSVAQVGPVSGSSAEVSGVGVGVARISGAGWKASNGATGCDLGSALLSVEASPEGVISANPNTIPVCMGSTTGITSITASANVYSEVRVYGAEGLSDGSVFFTLLAFEKKTVPTGSWVKQGTEFRLVAPGLGDSVLASVVVSVKQVVCPGQEPSVDLKAVNPDGSLSDGPVSVSPGTSTPLNWVSSNTDSCKAIGNWTFNTATSGTEPSGPVFSSKTFTIECTGPGGTATDSVTINVLVALNPSVDLKLINPDGSLTDGPVSVSSGGKVDLTWTSQNTDSCMATNGWTASQAVSGTERGIIVTKDIIFEIVCHGGGEEARDRVAVNVKNGGVTGGPVQSSVYNTSTASASGLSVACGQIIATWQRPSDPVDGFRMYYFDSGDSAWHKLWDIPYSAAQTIGSASNSRFFSRFTPPGGDLTGLFRYRVYTYLGGQEFSPQQDSAGSPIATDWPCESDFSGSNKDIVRIRDLNLPYDIRQNQDSNIEKAVPVITGDLITFQINVLNSGKVPFTGEIVVDDDMTNLTEPASGWSIQVNCNNECDHRVIDYNPITRRMTFVLKPRNNQSLAAGSVEVWTIRFTAKTHAENLKDTTYRFQNKAYLNGTTSPLLVTPRILVLPNGSPEIREIQ